ncbi:MAG: hypothetical protein ACKOQL_04390 [Actinomycetes bacterium]
MSKKEMGNDLPKEVKNLLNRRRVLQAGAMGGAAAFAAACGAGSNTLLLFNKFLTSFGRSFPISFLLTCVFLSC